MAQTLTITTAATEQATTWTPEEIAARKALWTATAARLAATMALDTQDERTAYLAAVEAEVGCTYAELQRAICQAAGPATGWGVATERRIMARGEPARGSYDGPGEDRGRGSVTLDALQVEGLDNGEPLPTQPPHNGVWVVVPCSYSGARTLTLVRATFGYVARTDH